MPELPKSKKIPLHTALSQIAKYVGKNSFNNDVQTAFYRALYEGDLIAQGKFDPDNGSPETLQIIPQDIWEQFTLIEFINAIYSEKIPVWQEPNKHSFYYNPAPSRLKCNG